jgi:uncharacterized damage-inducible protein DinB
MSEETIPALPYVHLLQGRDAAEVMRATPALLDALLARFTAEEIATRPAPGKWSLREVLCHIADCEIAWAWRLRQTYGEDRPLLQGFEQDPWARAYSGVLYTTEQALRTWRTLRAWNLALIETLSDEDKARPAVHAEAGAMTLWTLVEIAAGHDLHHIAGLEKLVAARGGVSA